MKLSRREDALKRIAGERKRRPRGATDAVEVGRLAGLVRALYLAAVGNRPIRPRPR